MGLWAGVLASAGTSREIANRWHDEVAKILALPDVREALAGQGANPDLKAPAEFSAYVASELAKWKKVVTNAGVKAE